MIITLNTSPKQSPPDPTPHLVGSDYKFLSKASPVVSLHRVLMHRSNTGSWEVIFIR